MSIRRAFYAKFKPIDDEVVNYINLMKFRLAQSTTRRIKDDREDLWTENIQKGLSEFLGPRKRDIRK